MPLKGEGYSCDVWSSRVENLYSISCVGVTQVSIQCCNRKPVGRLIGVTPIKIGTVNLN